MNSVRGRCLVLALTLAAPACAAEQRRTAGAATVGAGLVGVVAGLSIAAGCWPESDDDDEPVDCENDGIEPAPEPGLATVGVSLGVMVVGGIIMGAEGSASPQPPRPPAPKAAPYLR